VLAKEHQVDKSAYQREDRDNWGEVFCIKRLA